MHGHPVNILGVLVLDIELGGLKITGAELIELRPALRNVISTLLNQSLEDCQYIEQGFLFYGLGIEFIGVPTFEDQLC